MMVDRVSSDYSHLIFHISMSAKLSSVRNTHYVNKQYLEPVQVQKFGVLVKHRYESSNTVSSHRADIVQILMSLKDNSFAVVVERSQDVKTRQPLIKM
jgi:hypothetical protein